MNDEDIRRIVHEAVYETLQGLGIDASRQHEVQADFLYVRKMRKGSEALSRNIGATSITFLIPALLYMLWESIRQALWR